EARLLAGQDDDAVAARCGLSPVAVRWYHDLFFAVRPCRHATHYILNVVIGPKAHAGLSEKDAELLLKWFGFRYGAAAVDDLLRYSRTPPVVRVRLDGLGSDELDALRRFLRIRTAILAHTLPTDKATAGKVLLLADNPERPVTQGVGTMSPLLL